MVERIYTLRSHMSVMWQQIRWPVQRFYYRNDNIKHRGTEYKGNVSTKVLCYFILTCAYIHTFLGPESPVMDIFFVSMATLTQVLPLLSYKMDLFMNIMVSKFFFCHNLIYMYMYISTYVHTDKFFLLQMLCWTHICHLWEIMWLLEGSHVTRSL